MNEKIFDKTFVPLMSHVHHHACRALAANGVGEARQGGLGRGKDEAACERAVPGDAQADGRSSQQCVFALCSDCGTIMNFELLQLGPDGTVPPDRPDRKRTRSIPARLDLAAPQTRPRKARASIASRVAAAPYSAATTLTPRACRTTQQNTSCNQRELWEPSRRVRRPPFGERWSAEGGHGCMTCSKLKAEPQSSA